MWMLKKQKKPSKAWAIRLCKAFYKPSNEEFTLRSKLFSEKIVPLILQQKMMFKKISHILFAFLMMISTMGVTISKHYCGGNLQDVNIASVADTCCNDGGCCSTEIEKYQLEVDFSISSFKIDFTQFALVSPVVIQLLNVELAVLNTEFYTENPPPPPKIKTVLSSLQTYLL